MLLLNEDFVLRKIYGQYLLIPIKKNNVTNDALSLNDTAGMIFEECPYADNSQKLAGKIASKFVEIDQKEVIKELEEYINELVEQGLLVER